ncbi:MAG TPA: two-component regulator propeller domain-containing protein, partial [Bryobacteraceae bacterium]|nr:two-component regulator propeller domain-containing protein [Bryobacteraceae bacterium]
MRPFACFALLALAASRLFALDPGKALTQYAHRIWGQEQGLFQPTIYSILQTRDGFLWLGTQDSLIRFDGVQFREFQNPGSGVFHDALIRTLLQDQEGNLWVGSIGAGLGKIGPDGVFTHFDSENGFASDTVVCLDSGAGGQIFACTTAGLASFANGKFHFYTTADGLPSNQIRATCVAGSTRWVAGIDFGLATWDGTRFHSFSDRFLKPGDRTTALACGADGTVWAGTNAGLLEIRSGNSRLLSTRDGLPDTAISSLLNTPDGSLWVGTNDGIT